MYNEKKFILFFISFSIFYVNLLLYLVLENFFKLNFNDLIKFSLFISFFIDIIIHYFFYIIYCYRKKITYVYYKIIIFILTPIKYLVLLSYKHKENIGVVKN